MKKTILIFALAFTNLLWSQKKEIPEALPGTEYGAGVSESITYNVYTTDRVITELESQKELNNIIIQAKISGVCEKKGCWLTLENSKGMTVFVKMKDYAFFLPMSALGKTALLNADVQKKITSVEELKHYAEDAKKSKEEIEKITEPKTEIRVLAKGIKILN
jgi:predicted amidohydrolase YtcJ